MKLRDHDQPCEHPDWRGTPGKYEAYGRWLCSVGSCPGGRAVTIDDLPVSVPSSVDSGHETITVAELRARYQTQRLSLWKLQDTLDPFPMHEGGRP